MAVKARCKGAICKDQSPSLQPLSSVISGPGLKKATGSARPSPDMGNICQRAALALEGSLGFFFMCTLDAVCPNCTGNSYTMYYMYIVCILYYV